MLMKVLSNENSSRIFDTACKILHLKGIRVDNHETTERLKSEGCRLSEKGRLLFHEGLVHRVIETVPSEIVLHNSSGNPAARIKKRCGDADSRCERRYLAAGLNCIDMYDRHDGSRRPGTLFDVAEAATVCESLDRIDIAAPLCTPSDIPPDLQALEAVKAVTRNTGKPVAFTAHDNSEAESIWRHLADEAGGMSALSVKPCGLDLTGPTSPLYIGEEAVLRLRFAARHNLPVVCYPGIIPGAASPVTLSGALAQSGAEILAGIVIHQLENPGAPVMSGSAILPMDMRTGSITYGSPEYALACAAAVDFFSFIGIPSWTGGGCSDSALPDARAAAEAQLTMNAAVFSDTTLIHNAGYLASGRCGSLEMLVLADELIKLNERMETGIDCSENAIGFDLIMSAECGDDYMGSGHTIERMRSEMYYSPFFTRGTAESPDIWKKAVEKLESIL